MNSFDVRIKLEAEHNTVDELKELRQPFIEQLDAIEKSLGEDGLRELREKQNKDFLGSRIEYTEEEDSHERLKRVIEAYDEAIQHRTTLDSALLNPNEFQGFIDREASLAETNYFIPVRQRIALFPPYVKFFDGLKKLRQKMGRGEITAEAAFKEAQVLEKEAGLTGVVLKQGDDSTKADALLSQMKNDVDYLEDREGFSTGYDKDERAMYHEQIRKFFIPVRNGLLLKPIPPVEIDFENAVNTILNAVPTALLGKEPSSFDRDARFSITTARSQLSNMVKNDPKLRRALEEFFKASADELREEGHIVLKYPEPESPAQGVVKRAGPDGS